MKRASRPSTSRSSSSASARVVLLVVLATQQPKAERPQRLHHRRHPRDARRGEGGRPRGARQRPPRRRRRRHDGPRRPRARAARRRDARGGRRVDRARAGEGAHHARAWPALRAGRRALAHRGRRRRRDHDRLVERGGVRRPGRRRAGAHLLRPRGAQRQRRGSRSTSRAERPRRSSRAGPKVAPEMAFDDWTGGLAVPWAGETGQASAIPTLWGGAERRGSGQRRWSCAPRRSTSTSRARSRSTRTRTTYFNGSDRAVPAEIRMALPAGRDRLARRARTQGSAETEAVLQPGTPAESSEAGRLEWAGGGWLRGTLPSIPSGASVDLARRLRRVAARARRSRDVPLPDGERGRSADDRRARGATCTTTQGATRWISASAGASISGARVQLRRGDVRPAGDLVVEVAPTVVHAGRRARVRHAGRHGRGPVRPRADRGPRGRRHGDRARPRRRHVAERRARRRSRPSAPSSMRCSRGSARRTRWSSSPRIRPCAPSAPTSPRRSRPSCARRDPQASSRPSTRAARPTSPRRARAGGRRARRARLRASAGSGMVVYLGDGRPTSARRPRATSAGASARAPGACLGSGAVAVGHGADRWLLAQLVTGSGPVYEAVDRADAARVGACDRRRCARAHAARRRFRSRSDDRSHLPARSARGAGRGDGHGHRAAPRQAPVRRWASAIRRGGELVEESRPLDVVAVPAGADVPGAGRPRGSKRWRRAGDGIEPAVALARRPACSRRGRAGSSRARTLSWSFERRILALSPTLDGAFASRVERAPAASSLLLEPPRDFSGDASLRDAAVAAAPASHRGRRGAAAGVPRRAGRRASGRRGARCESTCPWMPPGTRSMFTCRRRPPATTIRCSTAARAAWSRRSPSSRPATRISLTHQITLPPGRTSRKTQCSVASTLPLPVRKGIWRSRLQNRRLDYSAAARSCELPTWGDRRALLELLLGNARSLRRSHAGKQPGATRERQTPRPTCARRSCAASRARPSWRWSAARSSATSRRSTRSSTRPTGPRARTRIASTSCVGSCVWRRTTRSGGGACSRCSRRWDSATR